MVKKKIEAKKKEENKKLSVQEFDKKVIELAKEGLTAEKIGEKLRKEGIHPKEHGKISRILKEKGLYHPPEIKNIKEKLDRVTAHKEKHIQDKRAMREHERIFSLLKRQKKYHNIT